MYEIVQNIDVFCRILKLIWVQNYKEYCIWKHGGLRTGSQAGGKLWHRLLCFCNVINWLILIHLLPHRYRCSLLHLLPHRVLYVVAVNVWVFCSVVLSIISIGVVNVNADPVSTCAHANPCRKIKMTIYNHQTDCLCPVSDLVICMLWEKLDVFHNVKCLCWN